jgi:hypothetical protein
MFQMGDKEGNMMSQDAIPDNYDGCVEKFNLQEVIPKCDHQHLMSVVSFSSTKTLGVLKKASNFRLLNRAGQLLKVLHPYEIEAWETGKEKEYVIKKEQSLSTRRSQSFNGYCKASVSFCYGERQGMLDMYFFYLFIINYAPNQFLVPSAILQQRCCNCVIETISRLLRIPRPITLQHIVAAGILIKLIQGLICKATSIRLEPHIDKPFIAFPKFNISGNVRIPVVPTNGGFRIH